MAIKLWESFQDGYRLINGTKLNRLFTGSQAIQSMRLGYPAGQTDAVQKLAIVVPAATTTDFVMALPAGATVQTMQVYTTTAFGAVTDAQISIGNAVAGAQYVAATSVKAAGVVNLAFAATAASAAGLLSLPATTPLGGTNLFVRITQSGGNSATGAATLVVGYVVP